MARCCIYTVLIQLLYLNNVYVEIIKLNNTLTLDLVYLVWQMKSFWLLHSLFDQEAVVFECLMQLLPKLIQQQLQEDGYHFAVLSKDMQMKIHCSILCG